MHQASYAHTMMNNLAFQKDFQDSNYLLLACGYIHAMVQDVHTSIFLSSFPKFQNQLDGQFHKLLPVSSLDLILRPANRQLLQQLARQLKAATQAAGSRWLDMARVLGE